MKRYRLTAEKPFEIDGQAYTGCDLWYDKPIKPIREVPKSFKVVGSFTCRERGVYESGTVTLYLGRWGYAASMFKDGCFYEYFAPCELIEQ